MKRHRMQAGVRATLAMIGLLGLAALAACARAPAEQRLRERIGEMVAAVESGNVAGFLDGVSADFSGNGGQFDRHRLHAMLRAIALRHRDIGVTHGPLDIEWHGADRATVKVTAIVTGGSGGLLPQTGRHIAIDSGWREEAGEWRCISASWQE